jgi:hypothetical protein
MRKTLIVTMALALGGALLAGCSESETPSGTYTGSLQEVKPDEKEIYLKTDEGKVLELYFKDDTVLQRGETEVPFSALQVAKDAGVKVTVEVENADGELIPKKVTIAE